MTHRPRALLLALLVLPLWLLGAGPAAAHSGLSSTSPAEGATVSDPLGAVVLTFSGAVRGPDVVVAGPDGVSVGTAEATADGSAVTVPVAPTATGTHTVTWAVTSADGHRLEGSYAFTYAGPVPTRPAASTTPAPGNAPATTAPAAATPSEAAATRDDSGPNLLVRGVPVLLAAAVVVGGVVLLRRRRT
ncbi:copper resistance protein CopC [Klenkia sp. PcliD-1-E]|uniref:copper resistance CopC family protein n=1 Tax=Klenkia sp. PcliD-1-E TaxID=2954492 RepID=UPI0020977F72|nr:copper resistance protein CopC [Klenkia sp. PcliD-1-E]MCO7220095.1 copper resistance protein CopC [Klenkia sp. PcliD-1-E]